MQQEQQVVKHKALHTLLVRSGDSYGLFCNAAFRLLHDSAQEDTALETVRAEAGLEVGA